MRTRIFRLACLSTIAITINASLWAQSNPVARTQENPGLPGSALAALAPEHKVQTGILDAFAKVPLSFEANHGQTDAQVKFLSRTSGFTLYLTGDEALLVPAGKEHAETDTGALRMKLHHANRTAQTTGLKKLPGTVNYFVGNDRSQWRSNIPTYQQVKYEDVYPGVDLVYYGNQRQLEYDFVVAPGGNPRLIQFDIDGASSIRQDTNGDLALKVGAREIRWHKPVVYQKRGGERQEIASHYSITAGNRVSFAIAPYDASKPLYIDPLIYSTYLGGSDNDSGNGIAVDSTGNIYIAGSTYSADFPTANAFQSHTSGGQHVFVTKLDASGSSLAYSTYLGGNGNDFGLGIALDSSGNAYITGVTFSTNFPTMNPLQASNAGSNDAFVTEIDSTGSTLVYSTYLGGSAADGGIGIAVDSSGNAYVAGVTFSSDFPTTLGSFQTTCAGTTCSDGFVTKITASGASVGYSTYVGGSQFDEATAIAVDGSGNAYITGDTYSNDFPTLNALQSTYGGGGNNDSFVTKLDASGASLVYSTYLGGSGNDSGHGIAVDSSGAAYFIGQTASTNFPTASPLQPAHGGGGYDVFVGKINPSGSALVYSTYLGGTGDDYGYAIAVNSAGNVYITGQTSSTDFPTKNALQPANGGTVNAFVTMIDSSGAALVTSTYFGGSGGESGGAIAVDSTGNTYLTGKTSSTDFPTLNPLQPSYGGGTGDAFVVKIGAPFVSVTAFLSSSNPSKFGDSVTFTATVTSQQAGTPTGSVTFSDGATVLGTSPLSGGVATLATADLSIGSHTIKAVYSGDANFGSSSASLNQAVTQGTTLSLTSDVNPSTYGQSVTFTAAITPEYGGQASGTITFSDGATILGSVPVSNNSAAFITGSLKIGTHSITAAYSGDATFRASTSNTVSQTVTKGPTTVTLVSSVNPSIFGKSVTFTATVSAQLGTPTGSVRFLNGSTVLASVSLTGGSAKYSTNKLPLGTNTITAVYLGNSTYLGSTSAPLYQRVVPPTVTTLTSLPNPADYLVSVTFTATVTSTAGTPPDGELVTFKEGTTVLGSAPLIGGVASLLMLDLTAGTHNVTAVYGGDFDFGTSTSTVLKQFVRSPTTTTVVSLRNPSPFGKNVEFSATVVPQFGGTPTGTVTFYDGATKLKAVSLTKGTAVFAIKTLSPGIHTITAIYGGSNLQIGSSAFVIQVVN